VLFAALLLQIPDKFFAETSVKDKTIIFLSDVVCLDLPKYDAMRWEHNITLPEFYPFNITRYFQEQSVSYTLKSKTSNITVDCNFKNGQIEYCSLHFVNGSPIYTQVSSNNLKQTMEVLLQKYQSYVAQNYAVDASYIEQAKNMINNVSKVESSTQIVDNLKLEISTNASNETSIKWIYTENGTDVPTKRLELTFDPNSNFRDTWSLFTVGTLGTISQEQAVSLALEAAKNCKLTFIVDNNITIEVTPDMPNVTYDAWLSFSPRRSATLYPYWRVMFYFDKPLYSAVGMQVGIWGDTKEIEVCTDFGALGNQGSASLSSPSSPEPTATPTPTSTPTASPTPSPSNSPTQQPTLEPTQTVNPTMPPNGVDYSCLIFGIVAAGIVAVTIVGLAVYSKKYRKKKTAN
jgi:hypothetical protein